MPQMYPLMWVTLFSSFAILLVIFITKLFFSNNYKNLSLKQKTNLTDSSKNWMW